MLDVVTQETMLEEVVDEVVLVGTKKPRDNPKKNLGDKLGNKPGENPGDKSEDRAPGSSDNQPDIQRPSINTNELNTLPNTGETQTGIATVAGLVALAVATRLRKKANEN